MSLNLCRNRQVSILEWNKLYQTPSPLRLRLFLLMTLLILSILFSVFAALMLTGTFTAGLREAKHDMEIELKRFQHELTEQYGQASAFTVDFSRELSKDLEEELALRGLTTEDLGNNPGILETLVGNQYERCLFSLQKARVSGAFFILDATVNPTLINASDSRAGLYIKNMEPGIPSDSSEYILLLRGFPGIGRENGIALHSQWKMEFNVSDADYFHKPFRAARDTALPISRLLYWSSALTLPGSTEQVMLCSAPLIDSKGRVFGVCGFEINSMLFKLSHMTLGDLPQRAVCILAPCSEQELSLTGALMSGGYSIKNPNDLEQRLTIRKDEPFNSYRRQDGALYSGLHNFFPLYPDGSAFEEETWIAALILPDEDISASVISQSLKLLILFLVLLAIGITLSYFLSRKFLIDFQSASRENHGRMDRKQMQYNSLPESIFDEFVRNTKRLSPAERAVFNLYVEGCTAKEVTKILCLSINTVKTHNKRIYMKLNVASREELLVYVNMLKEAGKEKEIL